jgi:hypothetical protein
MNKIHPTVQALAVLSYMHAFRQTTLKIHFGQNLEIEFFTITVHFHCMFLYIESIHESNFSYIVHIWRSKEAEMGGACSTYGRNEQYWFIARGFLIPWIWRRYVPPKRRLTKYLHGATSQKTAFISANIILIGELFLHGNLVWLSLKRAGTFFWLGEYSCWKRTCVTTGLLSSRGDWYSDNAVGLCLGGAGLVSGTDYRLSWLKFLVFFYSNRTIECRDSTLK